MRELLVGIAFYFINHILNHIPILSLRMFFYNLLSKGKISKKSSIALGVRILDIRNVTIGDYTNINMDCIIDGRGKGVGIGQHVDIAPQVNIWSLEHDPRSKAHVSKSKAVRVEDRVWLANRAIILPGSLIKSGAVVGAGAVVKGVVDANSIVVGAKAAVVGERSESPDFELVKIRMFR